MHASEQKASVSLIPRLNHDMTGPGTASEA